MSSDQIESKPAAADASAGEKQTSEQQAEEASSPSPRKGILKSSSAFHVNIQTPPAMMDIQRTRSFAQLDDYVTTSVKLSAYNSAVRLRHFNSVPDLYSYRTYSDPLPFSGYHYRPRYSHMSSCLLPKDPTYFTTHYMRRNYAHSSMMGGQTDDYAYLRNLRYNYRDLDYYGRYWPGTYYGRSYLYSSLLNNPYPDYYHPPATSYRRSYYTDLAPYYRSNLYEYNYYPRYPTYSYRYGRYWL